MLGTPSVIKNLHSDTTCLYFSILLNLLIWHPITNQKGLPRVLKPTTVPKPLQLVTAGLVALTEAKSGEVGFPKSEGTKEKVSLTAVSETSQDQTNMLPKRLE